MSWRNGLRQRAWQGIPELLEVDALLQASSVLAALPGARIAPGLVRFKLAARTCEGVQQQGLDWLSGARQGRGALAGKVPRYRPWKAGNAALAEIGIAGCPWSGRRTRRCMAAAALTAGTGCCWCRAALNCGWAGPAEQRQPDTSMRAHMTDGTGARRSRWLDSMA